MKHPDPEIFARESVGPMAEYTFPFISSIVGIEDENGGVHIGSGFRCRFQGKPCLVTAYHVAEQARIFPCGAGFVAARGSPPVRLGPPALTDTKCDLALFVLQEEHEASFWPEERIDSDPERRSHDYLFVHGFPGERSRFLFGTLQNRSLPYGAMERDEDLPADKLAEEFAVDFDPLWFQNESGTSADFVQPPGLSGSGVWRVGASHPWSPEQSHLVGVVTRYNQDKRVLLVTNASPLLMLAAQIR